MKIFIAGSKNPWSSETGYARILREKGCDVFVWDDKAPFPLFGKRDWWRLSRAERIAYDAIASVLFYKACLNYKPDILFMPKAENIHSYAVRRVLEETKARLVIWYPDNPFKADQSSANILRNLKRSDIFYIWGKFLVDPLRAAGCRRAEYLPFGFDAVQHPPETSATPEEQDSYKSDICFVGTWDPERELALLPLAEFDLGIWGPFWKERVERRSPLYPKIRGGGVFGAEMVKAFKSAKIVFNHLRLHNGSAHNARTMEITGVGGGPMLVRRTVEQSRELFVEPEHLMCFEDAEELRSAAQQFLSDSKARLLMAQRAQEKVFSEHLLSFRIDQILHDIS
jgi:spore maturation protein CgeB